MIDEREIVRRAADAITPPDPAFERLLRRRDEKQRNQKVRAGAFGLAVAIAVGWLGINAIPSGPTPADDRSGELGIFAPVAGRIVYENEGIDGGYDNGSWTVDPSGPTDPMAGPTVADDVASTLVPLDLAEAPDGSSRDIKVRFLGWSSDGTELLFTRSHGIFEEYLYVLHADGSETRLNNLSMDGANAAISPDGSRVVFVTDGLNVVDAEGGRPVRLPYPAAGEPVGALTFSPDGTQIAYIAKDGVWVTNADGTDAHEILTDEATGPLSAGASALEWSPAGDRLALGMRRPDVSDRLAIYTVAPDGSDLTRVIADGFSPYWSPDGSQIAYTIPCHEHPDGWCPEGSTDQSAFDPRPGESPAGLAIADADGSNVRAFGFAASGPWHPGAYVDDALPSLSESPTSSLPETPTPTPNWSPVQERDGAVHEGRREDYGIAWRDPHDASTDWIDVERVFTQESSDGYWTIELAAKPPPAAGLEPGLLIAYGLVLDTTSDGVADYLIGIDNDAPERGDFHVWVTDLATGVTDEQVGPPYGLPIEFRHPDEAERDDNYNVRTLTLTFLDGSGPADLDPETVRFYAWASTTRNGKVFASDFAPDDGWVSRT